MLGVKRVPNREDREADPVERHEDTPSSELSYGTETEKAIFTMAKKKYWEEMKHCK